MKSEIKIQKEKYGTIYWLDDQIHRDDGPAIEYKSGYKVWSEYGKIHRLNGPARIWSNGRQEWWYQGQCIDCQSQNEFEKIIKMLAFI